MPKAPPITQLGDPVWMEAREYVARQAPAQVGVQLKSQGNGLLDSGKATWAVQPVYSQQGNIQLWFYGAQWTPRGAVAPPIWLAILDVRTSELMLLTMEDLLKLVQAGSRGQAPVQIQVEGEYSRVTFNAPWAQQQGLIRCTFQLGKGDDAFAVVYGRKFAGAEQFAHLHVHSEYSILDGACSIGGIIRQAQLNGQDAVALTDHGFMYGLYKFYLAAKKAKIHPALGIEFYLVDDVSKRYVDNDGKDRRFEYHQTVLAMNDTGWVNLCTLASLACRDHFYHVPRIDHQMLFKHSEGLICLSGCFKGPVAWHLQHFVSDDGLPLPSWYRYDPEHSRAIARQYKAVFGDRYFIEFQANDFQRYMDALPELFTLSDELKIPRTVTGDVHFEAREDAKLQAMLTRISQNKVDEIGSKEESPYYLKAANEISHPGFTPDMFERAGEIAHRCQVNLDFTRYLFPRYQLEQDVDWPTYQEAEKGQVNA